MARVRRSCRGRKTRSRLSRSGSARRFLATKLLRSRGKRGSSRIDLNGEQQVAKELNFVDNIGTPLPSTGRRRSDRLLRRKSLEKTPFSLIPSSSNLIHDTAEGSTMEEIDLVPGDNDKIVKSMFGDVFDKASVFKVEVEQCVSLAELRVRPLHQFGIQRAVHILRGNSIGAVTGHVCVGKFPVVAELPEEYHESILQYFCDKGRDREVSKRFIASKPIYQVVNGGYEHEGRWRLIDASGYQFAGMKWRTVQIPWQDPKILRAISLMSSQVQKKELVVDLSFGDEMVHLRRIIEEHIMENAIVLRPGKPLPRGFCKEISKAYSGGKDYSNNTLRHLISIAAKMSMRMAFLMRQVIDEECLSVAKSIHRKKGYEDCPEVIDTRVFRSLINSKSLRGAKVFFAQDTKDEDRQNALHRLRYIAQEKSSYKGVDSVAMDKQVEAAISGRKAVEKFRERILRKDLWPTAMKPLLRNILWTTKLDPEIAENRSKPDELLPTLKHNYLEYSGVEGGTRVEQYEKFVQDQAREARENTGTTRNQTEKNLLSPSATAKTSTGDGFDEMLEDVMPDPLIDTEKEGDSGTSKSRPSRQDSAFETSGSGDVPPQQEQEDMADEIDPEPEPDPVLTPLERCNIEIHARTWEDYNRSVLNEQETFDFVISDPFQKAAAANAPVIDNERRIEFVKFIKKVLVPGGYVFLIVPQLQMSSWFDVFEEFELKPEGVFTLLKDSDSVQRVKGKSFQHLVEVAAVARKNGRHPTKFVMDIISPYTQLPRNRYKRRAPVIDNISPPTNRLHFPRSKTLVRTGEKPPGLIWELMKTFCPPGGKVLDPCAGSLTTGIAGIQSGRPCVLLESDKQCLSLAEARLTEIAVNNLKETDVGNMLSEPETDRNVFGSTFSEEGREASRSLAHLGDHPRTPAIDEQEINDVSQGTVVQEKNVNGSPSNSGDATIQTDVADIECHGGEEDDSENTLTQLPVAASSSELPAHPRTDSCQETTDDVEALDQERQDGDDSNDHGNVFNLSHERSAGSEVPETPKIPTPRITRKRTRGNPEGNLALHNSGPTPFRPQRKRKQNIRYK